MKKTLLSIFGIIVMGNIAFLQAPRFPLFEHFTQASCGPCAQQNPGFESTILIPNPDVVRHIAYHTSWPGTDPMNAYNPTEVADRVSYYGVTGVPGIFMGGNYKSAQPGGFSQDDVDDYFSASSPISIKVTETDMGSYRDVVIDVKTVGTVAGGTYKLYAAIVENPIDYTSPPGSNGETHFPNVFRKMMPSSSGDAYTPASIGSTVTFNYSYNEDAAWDMANIKVVAFVQNTSTKEILNSGTAYDPIINYSLDNNGVKSALGTNSSTTSFSLSSINLGGSSEDFIYTLTSDAPGDWSSSFTVNSSTFGTTGTVTTAAGATNSITVDIVPGTSAAVSSYVLSVSSVSAPTSPILIEKMYVIANVTDLIVHNTGGLGSGTVGNATNWASVYADGLAAAGQASAAGTTDVISKELSSTSSLIGVNNIYYNVGWTFPSLTDDEIPALESFLDNGGNLFLAGQDIGWEIADATSSYKTTAKTNFYKDYLHAAYKADGGTTNSSLTAVPTDAIYGGATSATINNYYGGSYFYPDEFTTNNGATSIFTYATSTRIGGLRYYNSTYKIVYVGVGMEMLDAANANEIITIAHDWFYSVLSAEQLDEAMNKVFNVYPNPTTGVVNINNTDNYNELQVFDLAGKMIFSTSVNTGEQTVNVSELPAGTYTVRLVGQNITSANKKLILMK
ncbi:MAG: Omp28-related outer membrane protein [Bacteroidia bacterium]